MRVSIWRQFSSNHSNDFTIVGRFKSVADAQSAAEELRTLLRSISGWYEAHPADELPRHEKGKYVPTDVERRIAAHYDIEWPNSPEWLIGWSSPEEAVFMIDECVFLDSPLSGVGYDPFDKILKKIGAEVVSAEQEMGEIRIFVNISATIRDAHVAKTLADKVQNYLDANKVYWKPNGPNLDSSTRQPLPPWVFHDVDRPSATEEAILQADELGRIDSRNLENLREAWRQLKIANLPDNDDQVKAAKEAWDNYQFSTSQEQGQLLSWLHEAVYHTSPLVIGNFEKVTARDTHIRIENLWFSSRLGRGLIALVSWLRAEGCEVSWEFREDKYPKGK